jgi:hypothetical protein
MDAGMTREFQALLISLVCVFAIIFSIAGLQRDRMHTWGRVFRIFQIFVMAYIGGLYAISYLNISGMVFGSSQVAMSFYRPGILLLVIVNFTDAVWRYRARQGK